MSYEKDYYAILQVSRNAKQDDIEKAYTRLSTVFDPATSNKKRAAQRHADVSAAYAVLRDPRRRRQYDRQLANDLASAGSMNPADVLSNRFVLLGSGIIFVTVLVILGLIVFVGGGGSSESVANTSATATAAPTRTPPASPPAVSGTPTTLADGLQYIVVTPGTGTAVATGDTVSVQYSGWLQDTGALFDSSYKTGTPFSVTVGAGGVIKGWEEGLVGMLPGETRRLIIPPGLAYGDAGQGSTIPGGATLVFDIDLLSAATPTPFGQTPAPTPPASPPDISSSGATPVTLADGLQYTIFQEGSGDVAAATGDEATVNYTGWVQATNALFDSSLKSGRTPFVFTLGTGEVIKGWDEGVVGMKIGEKRRLIVPPALAYKDQANGAIPANSTLIFDIELLAATPTTPTPAATDTATPTPAP